MPQLNLQPAKHDFELRQRQVMLAALYPMKGRMRQAGTFGKIRVGTGPAFLSQELCQLLVEIWPHARKLSENA